MLNILQIPSVWRQPSVCACAGVSLAFIDLWLSHCIHEKNCLGIGPYLNESVCVCVKEKGEAWGSEKQSFPVLGDRRIDVPIGNQW